MADIRERLTNDIALLRSFRNCLEEFHAKRTQLQRLTKQVNDNWMMGLDHNAARALANSLTQQMSAARQEIGKRIAEVTEITNRYPLRTQLIISPPRLLGGYVSRLNIFEAFIAPQLPYDFELSPVDVFDIVDQATWACEKGLRDLGPSRPTTKAETATTEIVEAVTENGSSDQKAEVGCIAILGVIGGVASIVGLISLIALFPSPSIDRDMTLDENNPFEVQFRVHNSSPWFDLYGVTPVCQLVQVKIGDVILKNGDLVHPDGFAPRLQAGRDTTFGCHVALPFKVDSPAAYKSGEVILQVMLQEFCKIDPT